MLTQNNITLTLLQREAVQSALVNQIRDKSLVSPVHHFSASLNGLNIREDTTKNLRLYFNPSDGDFDVVCGGCLRQPGEPYQKAEGAVPHKVS
jgi:hypothetical protein